MEAVLVVGEVLGDGIVVEVVVEDSVVVVEGVESAVLAVVLARTGSQRADYRVVVRNAHADVPAAAEACHHEESVPASAADHVRSATRLPAAALAAACSEIVAAAPGSVCMDSWSRHPVVRHSSCQHHCWCRWEQVSTW